MSSGSLGRLGIGKKGGQLGTADACLVLLRFWSLQALGVNLRVLCVARHAVAYLLPGWVHSNYSKSGLDTVGGGHQTSIVPEQQ